MPKTNAPRSQEGVILRPSCRPLRAGCKYLRIFRADRPSREGRCISSKSRVRMRKCSASDQALTAWRAPAGPATAGQGRKPRSGGAERASLYRMALDRHACFQAIKACSSRSQSQSARPCKRPVNSASWQGDARDVLPDALVEHRLPRHEAEAEAAIATEALDHCEPAAG
jgi:hypothetical protein